MAKIPIPDKSRKKAFWGFIKLLKEMYRQGERILTPETASSLILKASKGVPFPGSTRERKRYFWYWLDVAEKMGFIEDGLEHGVRGWVLTEKLGDKNG